MVTRRDRARATARRLAAAAAALALLGGIAACDPGPEEPQLSVTGTVGAPPVVQFSTPYPVAPTQVRLVEEGTGPVVTDGAPVVLATTSYDGETGEILDPATSGRPRVLRLTEADVGPDLHAAIEGVPEGSRLVVTQPVREDASGATAQGGHSGASARPSTPVEAGDADVAVAGEGAESPGAGRDASAQAADRMLVVVVDVLPTRATGDAVEVPADLGVSVGEDSAGAPTLSVDRPLDPAELRVVPLKAGSGATVVPGQEVTLQYLGADLATGEQYDSTWMPDRGPQVVAVDETFPGLRRALLDQQAGSRVLVLVPAAEAFGDAPLALVVDILATHGGDTDEVVRG